MKINELPGRGDAFSLLPREGNKPGGLPEEWGVKPDMPHVCSIRLAGSGRAHVARPLYFQSLSADLYRLWPYGMETDAPWYVDIVNGDGREEARRGWRGMRQWLSPVEAGARMGVYIL